MPEEATNTKSESIFTCHDMYLPENKISFTNKLFFTSYNTLTLAVTPEYYSVCIHALAYATSRSNKRPMCSNSKVAGHVLIFII